ncbi:MAG: (Fe-S)-binding protein [Candidatus Izemoplasmataceae bacterium]|jgi:Na+-translocating ferredoxin:NAD+ oxidoreductase subunit B
MEALITLGVLGGLGGLLGLGLAFAADYLKVEADPRLKDVKELLPGYDCGACGFPGCAAFAEGIIEEEVDHLSACKPGKDTHYNAILAYLKDHPNKDGQTIKVKK